MRLAQLVTTSAAVAATSSRREKVTLIADCLRALAPDETVPAVAYLSGELRQRQIGVGWASLADIPAPAAEPVLTVSEVDTALARIGEQRGTGSTARRRQLLAELFGAATAGEQRFLRVLLAGELRQGALAGVMADAVAKAAAVPVADVRRALLLSGDLREVAAAALHGGADALAGFRLQVGRPLAPMLAQPASNVDDAMAKVCPAVVDYKLDGVRVQVHRDGDEVAVFTRSLDDITSRLPEVVAAVRDLPVRTVVLDGEVIALRPDGRPQPFQVTASRVGQRGRAGAPTPTVTLRPYFFDVLHLDGEDLLDAPGRDRWAALESVVPEAVRVPRRTAASVAEAAEVFAAAVDAGHEGVVVKSPEARYDAGRRGVGWLKVKPRHTLDLVILAAEWGHGRRRGWLSNLHLGARDDTGHGHVMLGQTFKGLTDEMLRWQTARLQELETHRDSWTVYVRPELVVEIAFDGLQASSRYPGGLALRFARVLRYRDDKPAAEADTIATVRAIHSGHVGD